jgi:hypothetical protein
MKTLLINPYAGFWITRNTMPLGLAYIAAVLEKVGHTVKAFDLTVERKGDKNMKLKAHITLKKMV